jgi:hypothetical protein
LPVPPGAIGGAGIARGMNPRAAAAAPRSLGRRFLTSLISAALLRYLAVAHYGCAAAATSTGTRHSGRRSSPISSLAKGRHRRRLGTSRRRRRRARDTRRFGEILAGAARDVRAAARAI